MSGTAARRAYAWLMRLALPVVLLRWWWRGRREPPYRTHWRERLGGGKGDVAQGRLWLHAVSLGETRAAAPLIAALRAQRPAISLLLTHGTATGREAGRELLREADAQAWLPYDTPGAVRRFLRRHRPCAGVLLETEVWPALLQAARRARIPMVLANARLSERSGAKGERMGALMRPALAAFSLVLAQTGADAERLRALGAADVRVMGNLKFDMSPPPAQLVQGRAWRAAVGRPVVLAAATREGEEDQLLRAWASLRSPRPMLLLVPRHPQRFDAVAALVVAAGLQGVRRSGWGETPPAAASAADVWLGDSIGEMPLYYALADVALLGGSFAPLGGQNLIEAAACGCPLLMGPHTFNFEHAAELALAAGAGERMATLAEAVERAVAVAGDPEREAWSARALAFTAQHRGAAERMAAAVLALVPADAPRTGGSNES
jgi:3-deoxy-D-manno-octulosonic-acid transferase